MGSRRKTGSRPRGSLTVPLALAAALVAVLAAVLVIGQGDAGVRGAAIVPERTTHDFGNVSMGRGLLNTRFPLAVQSPVTVTGLSTT